MKKEMLINVLQPEECRIAILEDGTLEELYVERTGHESYVGNIYKGRIVNIEPSIQAAFVDFGVGRNGFLHVSDVEPAYYRHLTDGDREEGRRRNGRRPQQPPRGRRPAASPPPPEVEIPEEIDTVVADLASGGNLGTAAGPDEVYNPADLLPPGLGDASEISVLNEFPAGPAAGSTEEQGLPAEAERQVEEVAELPRPSRRREKTGSVTESAESGPRAAGPEGEALSEQGLFEG